MTKISLLGIPHDDNSSFAKGAAQAPAKIRPELFSDAYSMWSETGFDLTDRLVDHGDIDFSAAGDPWELIKREVGRVLECGDPLICLGGDHAISWPVLRAVRRRHPNLTILHIDAHPDMYDAYQDNPRSHTSPFARIMEERLADRLIQVGLRTINDHHRDQFKRFGVEVIEAARFSDDLKLDLKTPVYISMDLDGLDPAFAPGVSHREPGGLTTRQVISLIQTVDKPIVAADIVELNPARDISNLTAGVAAKLLKEIAGMMLRTAGGGGE
ncbi:MAG: agmatinase [Mesorhizobium sp.]|nr:agmatinase [bacterium M00.F.Ca.ET.205.01.1.1]TGU50736.1 agmatinase [bacterium M00.F.Ca.ET.152.01.1.1]TGV34227.1 agmatinase [Mesorhizobium sp. M00.F.Ca.ET.186.01.1.1]TGZ42105.1 agmatinase [bacterium M00.F.Ca.ET.162.01.1.1]TJW33965.1 MAG: agmatinase [Mesorhizobium sp.]